MSRKFIEKTLHGAIEFFQLIGLHNELSIAVESFCAVFEMFCEGE